MFQYYGHKSKLKVIGREDDLEKLNRKALQMARQVADENHVLMAGNICNTNSYEPNNKESDKEVEQMFKVNALTDLLI